MRTIRKNVALLVCAVLLVMAAAIGITGLGAKASTMDSFVTNNGNETDFQDTWGQTKMSADIIDGDKTLVCAQGIVWGFRIVLSMPTFISNPARWGLLTLFTIQTELRRAIILTAAD